MRAVVALAAVAVTLAACGGSTTTGPASSAEVLKPGALVYWQTVSDPDSDQWEQAETLLKKFPDGDRWIAQLKDELADEGVTWEGDVEPALGSVVDVAVYSRSGNAPAVVGLTNPDDEAKLLALVEKLNARSDEAVVTRSVGDWVAISDTQDAIDAAVKGESGESLADAEAFESAMEDLPADALSRVYVDPARAIELAGEGPERRALAMLGLDELEFAGAWAKAKDDGAELAVALRGAGADKLLGTAEPYTSRLLDHVPEDAFAFVTFQGGGLRGQLESLRQTPFVAPAIREFEQQTGIDLEEALALLQGEVAFYVRPGGAIPEFTFLLDSTAPDRDRESVERILRSAVDFLGGEVTEAGDVTTAQFDDFRVSLGTAEGAVVLSTSTSAFTRTAEGLADSDRFSAALEAAGAPEEYTGLSYVDVTRTWEVIRSYLDLADEEDVPPELSRNLEPVRSLVVYGKEDGSLSTSLAFVEID